MKKRGSLIISVAGMLFAGSALAGCSPEPGPGVVIKDFTGIAFEDATVTFDGQAHELVVTGVPEGATIVYGEGGNSFTEVGEHEITVTVSMDGYNDYTGSATLSIIKADFQGVAMANKTVEFNGEAQTIDVTGVPEGATVTYTAGKESAVLPGTHAIEAKVSKAGYNDLTLSATLTINNFAVAEDADKFVLADSEDVTLADLGEEWGVFKYESGWVANSKAYVGIGNGSGLENSSYGIGFHIWSNGNKYMFSKQLEYDSFKKYSGFAIDTLPEFKSGTTGTLTIRFWLKDITIKLGNSNFSLGGQYFDYQLSLANPTWTHWEIPFTDAGWVVNRGMGGTAERSGAELFTATGIDLSTLALFADRVSIIEYSTQTSGIEQNVFIDNFKLKNVSQKAENSTTLPIEYTNRMYIWNGDSNHFVLESTSDFSKVKLTAADGTAMTGAGTQEGNAIKVALLEDALTFDVNLSTNKVENVAGTLTSSPEGQGLATCLEGKNIKPGMIVNQKFDDGTTDANYVSSVWSERKYSNNAWGDVATVEMRSKVDQMKHKVVNFSCDSSDRIYVLKPSSGAIGPINHISLDMGNYFSTASDIKYKIFATDSTGNYKYYFAGSDSAFEVLTKDITKGNFLRKFDFTIPNNKCAYTIKIQLKATAQSYLYVDNLVADLIAK